MNAQIEAYASGLKVITGQVTGFEVATQRVKGKPLAVKGYALNSDTKRLGFIETTQPLPRIEELLTQYTAPGVYFTARELMRDLLNVEDYRSPIYDAIVRVYYPEDFT